MGLKQHVKGSTHEGGHTLDLVITRKHDDIIKNAPVIDRFISDHVAVLCPLNSVKPTLPKFLSYLNFREAVSLFADFLDNVISYSFD